MKRPKLNEIPIDEVMQKLTGGGGIVVITMSGGQWDALLLTAYDMGQTLLELDGNERPVAAYRRQVQ